MWPRWIFRPREAPLCLPPCVAGLSGAGFRSWHWQNLPISAQVSAARKAGYKDCLARCDQELVLESVARIVSPPDAFDAELVGVREER